jgi:Zn-dependent M28 family amino/carboxypeptidase
LQPILKDAKGTESFFQPVPLLKTRTYMDKPLTIKTPTGEMTFRNLEEMRLVDKGPSLSDAPVVFIGFGISEPSYDWNDLKNVDTKGKIVVLLMGAPFRDGKPVFPDSIHNSYSSLAGTRKKVLSNPFFRQHMPAAVYVIADNQHVTSWKNLPDAFNERRIIAKPKDQSSRVPTGPAMVGIIKGSIVETLFRDQVYSPIGIEERGLQGYKSFDLAGVTLSVGIESVGDEFESMNVVGLVPGTDNSVSREYITLGAHLDHVNPRNGEVCNGADDNASGSVGVLEIAEAIAMQPLRRPVVFCLFTAEESGLLGSKHFVADSPIPVSNITANITLDMIGRSDPAAEKTRKHYIVGSDKTNPEFRKLIDSVNNATVQWPLDFESEDRSMAGSDHMSFHKIGIPVAFFFSGRHQDLHMPTDDAEKIDYEKMQKLTQLAYEVTVELGNRKLPLRPITPAEK